MANTIHLDSNNVAIYNHYMQAFTGSNKAMYNNIKGRINNLVSNILLSSNSHVEFIDKIENAQIPHGLKTKAQKLAHIYFGFRTDEARAFAFKLKAEDVVKQYSQLKPLRNSTDFSEIKDSGGAVNVGFLLLKQYPQAKIGTMLAANSGLPGGYLNYIVGNVTSTDMKRKTQEESVWANAILTACGENSDLQKNYHHETIHRKWGMKNLNSLSTETIQGVDFTKTENSEDYNEVYVLNNALLSAVDKNKKIVAGSKYPVTLCFVDGPNANPRIGKKTGTMQRTLNQRAINDYDFFRDCVKQKLRSSLDAMAIGGVTIPLVALLSCGIYAGKHQARINSDFRTILDEVLNEEVGLNHEKRGWYFEQVVIPLIG